jgi:hypothetical protein
LEIKAAYDHDLITPANRSQKTGRDTLAVVARQRAEA